MYVFVISPLYLQGPAGSLLGGVKRAMAACGLVDGVPTLGIESMLTDTRTVTMLLLSSRCRKFTTVRNEQRR